jgi:nicotinamidase-related amidase
MHPLPRPDRFAPPRWLVCLDLQREFVVPGRPSYAAANAAVVAACRRVLEIARAARWRVVHSQHRDEGPPPAAHEMFGAPIEGLRPLVSESVFFRRGLSAFGNPAFAAELRRARGGEVFLIGFSLPDSCLATALAAVDEGLSLTLLEDAVGEGSSQVSKEAAHAVLRPFLSILPSSRLMAQDLEVIG